MHAGLRQRPVISGHVPAMPGSVRRFSLLAAVGYDKLMVPVRHCLALAASACAVPPVIGMAADPMPELAAPSGSSSGLTSLLWLVLAALLLAAVAVIYLI